MDRESLFFLQKTIDSLTVDQIEKINETLAHYQKTFMTTKDRKALLEYWITAARGNEPFRVWMICQLESVDGPRAVTAFETVVGQPSPLTPSSPLLNGISQNESNSYMTTKYCISVILIISVAIGIMIVAVVLYLPQFDYTTNNDNSLVPKRIVVAENDTVIAGTYKSSSVTLSVKEIVLKGDDRHECYLLVVPNNILKYHWNILTNTYNGTTIVDQLPIINYMYVYLLSGSSVSMKICLGNVSSSPLATLYGFDNESQYIDYNKYLTANNFSLRMPLTVGGPDNIVCTNVTFTASSSNYYFFILLAPLEGTRYIVKTTVNEKYINYRDYLVNYTYCVLANERNCSLSLSVGNELVKSDVAVLAYTVPTYSFRSKISHLDITVEGGKGGSVLNHNQVVTFWCLVSLGSFLIVLGVLVVMYLSCLLWLKRKKRCNRSKYIGIPDMMNYGAIIN